MKKVGNKEEFLKLIETYKEDFKGTDVDTNDLELFEPEKYPCFVNSNVNSCYEGFESYFLEVEYYYFEDFFNILSEAKIKTKIGNHNNYNGKIVLSKNNFKKLGLEVNDNIEITKLEEGKFLVEKEVKE